MILLIDNYDSFTYNLVQRVGELNKGRSIEVRRNDAVTLEQIDELAPSHLIISPGPGTPDDGGISMDAIRHVAGKVPILGVCLGHQCIGEVFGAKIIRAPEPVHGKTAEIFHQSAQIFRTLPTPFEATRYHSLIIDRISIPDDLEITAETKDGLIMGIRHKKYPVSGVQFHPESVLTTEGKTIINNWLEDAGC